MRFEETEKYAELIRKFEDVYGLTPKSFQYKQLVFEFSFAANVVYSFNLGSYVYIDDSYVVGSYSTFSYAAGFYSLGITNSYSPPKGLINSVSVKPYQAGAGQLVFNVYIAIF